MVERICGIPPAQFAQVAEALVRNSGPDRTTGLCYAVGWTQHTAGVQMIRAASILQLLLGNTGRPGGGVIALRGHASIQGSTDIPTLYDLLPGYLHMPRAREQELDLASYVDSGGADRGWWSNFDKYIVSLLKAWFGDAATAENDYGFERLPKISGIHAHFPTMLRAFDGGLDGLFVMGQNPAVGSEHSGLQRRALSRLKWLVVRDLREIETATFWRDGPEIESGELRTEDIGTEVFLMPAATYIEKEGCFTNTERLVQWRDKALDPPHDCRSELWFMHHLFKRVRAHYARSEAERDWPIRNLKWDYSEAGPHAEPSADEVLREINGYVVETGELVPGFAELANDGSTACGCWIYSGIYADGVNQARRRDPGELDVPGGWVAPGWAWAWPANRRALYNRTSARPDGTPWSERKRYVWWDPAEAKWTGYDVPDFPVDKPPDYVRAGRRARHGRDRRRRAVHHAGRRARLAVRAVRAARRADAVPRRAARVAGRQRALSARHRQPGGAALGPGRQPGGRARGSAVAVRRDHVPAHRAPHGRRHVPLRCPGWRSCSRRCSRRSIRSWPASTGSRTAAG